ncbi:sulfurtransferase [Paenibacillus sinopodophylli]|uniref:sulfurtransferase n=1 Tax=Paenibacillus sinopodophylli TaxID=1837342 RepID=UPI00110CD725|nr:rhodanese-like domain-containing protein [Paenibacillus sinopodophylli]
MTKREHASYTNNHLLVDKGWLAEHRHEQDIVLLDARAKDYEDSHIPGAYWLDVRTLKDQASKTIAPLDTLKDLLNSFGISNSSTIIVYDDGSSVQATRAFYVLEYYGFRDQVKLLNGGYAAWLAEGFEVTREHPSARTNSKLNLTAHPLLITTKESIQAEQSNRLLLDTRTSLEYTGEDLRSNRKGGHIPGAVHKEWSDSLEAANQDGVILFKDALTLEREFQALGILPSQTIVPYCQSNQRGAHSYFILRLLGYPDIRPYEGSWEEWGNDEHTEVVALLPRSE